MIAYDITTIPTRRTFVDDALQAHVERFGFATMQLLDADLMHSLIAQWSAKDAAIHGQPFHASCMSDDLPYRRWVADLLIPMLREHLDSILVDHKLLFSNFVVKRAGSTIDVAIHQDPTFLDERVARGLTLWIPLVDVSQENGCLKVIAGSHLMNGRPRGSAQVFPYSEHLDALRPLFFDVKLRAGEAFFMDSRLFHWSAPNPTAQHRVCIGAVAIPTEHTPWYCYQPRLESTEVEMYEVEDDYYHTFVFGHPPRRDMQLGAMLPCKAEELTDSRLAELVDLRRAFD